MPKNQQYILSIYDIQKIIISYEKRDKETLLRTIANKEKQVITIDLVNRVIQFVINDLEDKGEESTIYKYGAYIPDYFIEEAWIIFGDSTQYLMKFLNNGEPVNDTMLTEIQQEIKEAIEASLFEIMEEIDKVTNDKSKSLPTKIDDIKKMIYSKKEAIKTNILNFDKLGDIINKNGTKKR